MKLRRQKGVAAVELALILVPLLVLCFGIIELGRAVHYYNGMVKATRGAARYLSGQGLSDPAAYAAASAVARWLAVCRGPVPSPWTGQTCPEDDLLLPGVNEDKVTVTSYSGVSTGAGSVSLVSVQIGDANPDGAKAVKFKVLLPYVFTDWEFAFSPVRITMAWSTT